MTWTSRPLETRFWEKVDRRGPDECWTWTSTRNPKGYGRIFQAGSWLTAHRVAWTLTNGPIPPGMLVLHKCDNPPCCNPAHLWLGTHQDNMGDRLAKGRNARMTGRPRRTPAFHACEVCGATFGHRPGGANRFCGHRCYGVGVSTGLVVRRPRRNTRTTEGDR